jgi:hypothetical protein
MPSILGWWEIDADKVRSNNFHGHGNVMLQLFAWWMAAFCVVDGSNEGSAEGNSIVLM